MAILGFSVSGGTIRCANVPEIPFEAALGASLHKLPAHAPIVVLIHGYKFSPSHPRSDPHRLIFAPHDIHTKPKFASWPRGLGFASETIDDGLCIGFAWPASQRDLPGSRLGTFARTYLAAARAGRQLARVISAIRAMAPSRSVHLLAHSLGARVALQAIAAAPPGAVGQTILLGGAEYDGNALACLTQGAGPAAQVFNVTARENALFDLLLNRFSPPERPGLQPLSTGLGRRAPNTFDLPLDQSATLAMLQRRGIALAPQARRICHWSFYTRPGTMALYESILRYPNVWTPATLWAEMSIQSPNTTWLDRTTRGGFGMPLTGR